MILNDDDARLIATTVRANWPLVSSQYGIEERERRIDMILSEIERASYVKS